MSNVRQLARLYSEHDAPPDNNGGGGHIRTPEHGNSCVPNIVSRRLIIREDVPPNNNGGGEREESPERETAPEHGAAPNKNGSGEREKSPNREKTPELSAPPNNNGSGEREITPEREKSPEQHEQLPVPPAREVPPAACCVEETDHHLKTRPPITAAASARSLPSVLSPPSMARPPITAAANVRSPPNALSPPSMARPPITAAAVAKRHPPPITATVKCTLTMAGAAKRLPATTAVAAAAAAIVAKTPPDNNGEGSGKKGPVANPYVKPTEPPAFSLDGGTWAERNPDLPKQPERVRPPSTKLGEAEKAALKLKGELRDTAKAAYLADIVAFQELRDKWAAEIAEKHEKTVEEVGKQLRGKTSLVKERNSNLWNAKVWKLAQELNKDRPAGDKLRMKEVQVLAKTHEAFQDMTEEEQEVLILEFSKARGLTKSGVRLSNSAAARDVCAFVKRMNDEMLNLQKRTGALAFVTVARSSHTDTLQPACVGPPEAMQFLTQVLHTTDAHFALKFDTFGIHRESIGLEHTSANLRKETGFELVGWLEGIPFQSPSSLATIEKLKPLYDALVSGACYWNKMSDARKADYQKEVIVKEKKVRNARSDKGMTREEAKAKKGAEEAEGKKKRKRSTSGDGDDKEGESKRKRADLSSMTEKEKKAHPQKVWHVRKARLRAAAHEDEDGKEDGDAAPRKRKASVRKRVKSRATIDNDDDSDSDSDEGDGNDGNGNDNDERPAEKPKRPKRKSSASAGGSGVHDDDDDDECPAKKKSKRKGSQDSDDDDDFRPRKKSKGKGKAKDSGSEDRESSDGEPYQQLPLGPNVQGLNRRAGSKSARSLVDEHRRSKSTSGAPRPVPRPVPRPLSNPTAAASSSNAKASTSQLPASLTAIAGYATDSGDD
ncbi:hypothetical protein B0H11DRAFT_2185178 [Mycena galericulata]|nr:hypothetical protein B0H11DRAFT_2185178 [Mycena galericulata]